MKTCEDINLQACPCCESPARNEKRRAGWVVCCTDCGLQTVPQGSPDRSAGRWNARPLAGRKAKSRPLIWRPHHVRGKGWHGYTVTEHHVCYVYQPVDMRIKRGPMPWQVHCYFGPQENPLKGSGRFDRFPTARAAKAAAQAWWRRQMAAMKGGAA